VSCVCQSSRNLDFELPLCVLFDVNVGMPRLRVSWTRRLMLSATATPLAAKNTAGRAGQWIGGRVREIR
jgi:hypothetical protein